MYHQYTIQPSYHHDVYLQDQCAVNPIIINENPNQEDKTPIKYSQYDSITSNEICPQVDEAPLQNTTQSQKTIQSKKAPRPKKTAHSKKTIQTQKTVKTEKKPAADTSHFSIEERLVAAVWVHERKRMNTGMSQIRRNFLERFGRDPPAKNTMQAWERKLFATGNVCDAPRSGRPVKRWRVCSEVSSSLQSEPSLSERARARRLGVPRSTLRAVLARDLRPPATPHSHTKAGQDHPHITSRAGHTPQRAGE